jgi:hypothetical protein
VPDQDEQEPGAEPTQGIDAGVVISADAGTVSAIDLDEAIEEAEADRAAGADER